MGHLLRGNGIMAISVSNLTTGHSKTADPSTANVDPSTASDSFVFVWIGASNSGTPPPTDSLTLSGGGATWTKIYTAIWRGRRRCWLFVGSGWTETDPDTIDLTFTGTDPEQFVWSVDEATGLNTTTPYRALGHMVHPDDAKTSEDVLATSVPLTGEATYACVQLENNQTSLAATGFVELGAVAPSSPDDLGVRRLETAWDTDALRTAAWTWGGSSQGFAGVTLILCDDDTSDEFEYVQSSNGAKGTTNFEASFDTAPTEGNLLIAVLMERGSTDPPTGDSMTTSGYTKIGYQRTQGSSSTYRRGVAVYYKFAGSSEGTAVEGGFTPSSSNDSGAMAIAEFKGVGTYNDAVWSDNGATSNGTALLTSTNSTTAASCMIAIHTYKMKTSDPGLPETIVMSYTNNFIHVCRESTGSTHKMVATMGLDKKTSSGSYSTTGTISADGGTDNYGIDSILIDFDVPSTGEAATDSPAIMGACF
jgi:hypothetical protein